MLQPGSEDEIIGMATGQGIGGRLDCTNVGEHLEAHD